MQIPFLPISSADTLKFCKGYELNEPTIFIASYPKSGTTWMQWIVFNLLAVDKIAVREMEGFHISNYCPFFEIDRTWNSEGNIAISFQEPHQRIGARLFNTHLPWEIMPKGTTVRYVYCVRRGRDVCTSFYYHLSNQVGCGGFSGDFKEFVRKWCGGEILFGPWINHLREWILASHDLNNHILIVYYEEMIEDLEEVVKKIVIFLNCQIPEEKLHALLPLFSFDYMKANLSNFQPTSVQWKSGFEFIRKGQVNDSKNIFTETEEQYFMQMIQNEFPNNIPEWLLNLV